MKCKFCKSELKDWVKKCKYCRMYLDWTENNQSEIECPECWELIIEWAKLCRYCWTELEQWWDGGDIGNWENNGWKTDKRKKFGLWLFSWISENKELIIVLAIIVLCLRYCEPNTNNNTWENNNIALNNDKYTIQTSQSVSTKTQSETDFWDVSFVPMTKWFEIHGSISWLSLKCDLNGDDIDEFIKWIEWWNDVQAKNCSFLTSSISGNHEIEWKEIWIIFDNSYAKNWASKSWPGDRMRILKNYINDENFPDWTSVKLIVPYWLWEEEKWTKTQKNWQ